MFTLQELQLIRAGLDILTIRGADAKFLAQLQTKVEECLNDLADFDQSTKTTKK